MEKNNENVLEGFCFINNEEYNKALKEYETIMYVQKKIDMTNKKMVLSVYNKLLADSSFTTIVGKCYLKNLYDFIIANGISTEQELPRISIDASANNLLLEKKLRKTEVKNVRLIKTNEEIKRKNDLLKFVIATMCVVLVALFIMVFNSKSINYLKTKNAILDEYSTWQSELDERENAIKEYEDKYGINDK